MISIGCILIIAVMIVLICWNWSYINKKRNIYNYNKKEVSLDYVTAVQLPTIGSNTIHQNL